MWMSARVTVFIHVKTNPSFRRHLNFTLIRMIALTVVHASRPALYRQSTPSRIFQKNGSGSRRSIPIGTGQSQNHDQDLVSGVCSSGDCAYIDRLQIVAALGKKGSYFFSWAHIRSVGTARLPSTRRVRAAIRKRKQASYPGSSDHDHLHMGSCSRRLRDTAPIILSQLGVHPPRFQLKVSLSGAYAYVVWFIRTARQFLGTMFLLFLQHYGGAVVVESGLGDLGACVPFELDGHAALIFHVKGRAASRK